MYWKVLTHDYRPPLQGGEPLCDGATWPVTLATVPLDRSNAECGVGGGWHFCRDIEDALRIAGMWPDGWPSAVIAVEPHGDVIERADKCRAASLTLTRLASEDEINKAIRRFSKPFGLHQNAMAEEQIAWRRALARPERDAAKIEQHLTKALASRGLSSWSIQRFPSARAAWDARASWDAWDAWDASAASAARAARTASAASASWDAWDASAASAARAASAAWDARAALMVQFAARTGWTSDAPDLLTLGIRDAYQCGLELAVPRGAAELGWAAVSDPGEET